MIPAPIRSVCHWPKRHLPISLIIGLCFVSQFTWLIFPELKELLAFNHQAVERGGWYRLISGAMIHTNGYHLLMNVAGLVAITLLFGKTVSSVRGFVAWLSITVLSGLAIYLLVPEVKWFVGLSGSLHGLLAWAALTQLPKHLYSNIALLIGLTIKIVFEQVTGGDTGTSELIGARVLIEGHLMGALSGVVVAFVTQILVRLKK
ncbi:rhombosortase [Corallincola luteus]|uniref:Rhombosortase n=1 Tax=Corallincola luteus TaxID=1775177 RepID=A0ABY2ANQ1_9GAMM|nr:rhombosortase [Corallincola luteus]TCI03309.1 rhombosortase [Corallincola luteus]